MEQVDIKAVVEEVENLFRAAGIINPIVVNDEYIVLKERECKSRALATFVNNFYSGDVYVRTADTDRRDMEEVKQISIFFMVVAENKDWLVSKMKKLVY